MSASNDPTSDDVPPQDLPAWFALSMPAIAGTKPDQNNNKSSRKASPEPEEVKVCPRCKKPKPISAFRKKTYRDRKNNLRQTTTSYCKCCASGYQNEWGKLNRGPKMQIELAEAKDRQAGYVTLRVQYAPAPLYAALRHLGANVSYSGKNAITHLGIPLSGSLRTASAELLENALRLYDAILARDNIPELAVRVIPPGITLHCSVRISNETLLELLALDKTLPAQKDLRRFADKIGKLYGIC